MQDGEVDAKEFADAVKKNCMNKAFADMPGAFKAFIDQYFKSIDVDGNYSCRMKYRCAKCRLVEKIIKILRSFYYISNWISNC